MQVAGDGRERGRDDGLVERRQRHAEHQSDEDHEDPSVLGLRLCRIDRFDADRRSVLVNRHESAPRDGDRRGEQLEEARELGAVLFRPALEHLVEPELASVQQLLDRPPAGRREPDPRRTCVVGVGRPRHQPGPFELLHLPGDRGRVDAESLGELAEPDVLTFGEELVEERGAPAVEIDTRLPAEGVVGLELVHHPSERQQRRRGGLGRAVLGGGGGVRFHGCSRRTKELTKIV